MTDISYLGIDAENEKTEERGFRPLPAGRYTAAIEESCIRPTKSGNGRFLELTFRIIAGEHEGRKLWMRYNIDNPSETAVKIAKAELAEICRAVGVMRPRDSAELHNIPLMISVIIYTRDGMVRNKIIGYSRANVDTRAPQPSTPSTPTGDDIPF